MKTVDLTGLKAVASKNRYVLLVLALGLVLLLIPGGGGDDDAGGQGSELVSSGIPLDTESGRIADFLADIYGVGRCRVLLSTEGAVIACEGAENAQVRLCVINAVSAYTGLGSDKISVIKLK